MDSKYDEYNNVVEILYKFLTLQKKPSQRPIAYILGGQPGSGKTTLHRLFMMKDKEHTVIINGDDYRVWHPRFKELHEEYGEEYVRHTQEFVNYCIETLIEKLGNARYNLIIEGTLRNKDVPIKTAHTLKAKGYIINLAVMAVSKQDSWQGTIDRYNRLIQAGATPRKTSREAHNTVINNIVANIGYIYELNVDISLFNSIELYNRDGKCMYSSLYIEDYNPARILNKAINGEFNRNNLKGNFTNNFSDRLCI